MISCRNISLEDKFSWDDLIKESSTATFFQTKKWLSLWTKHFKCNAKVQGVFDDEKLIGLAPLEVKNNKVNFLGLSPVLGKELVSDFGDIIAVAGKEREVWKETIERIKNQELGIREIELNFIREDSPSFSILKELGGQIKEVEVAPYLILPPSWEEYLASLDRHDRHELRRKIRKAEAEEVTLADYSGNPAEIEIFFGLMEDSDERKKSFLSKPMKEFFHEIITTFCAKKMARLTFLKKDNQYLAGVLLFLFRDEMLLYNSGFDPSYTVFPTGIVLKALTIERAIEEKKARYDFLRGNERYKYDLGAKERRLYKITFVLEGN